MYFVEELLLFSFLIYCMWIVFYVSMSTKSFLSCTYNFFVHEINHFIYLLVLLLRVMYLKQKFIV